jgi:hypothetical protein
MYIVNNKKIDMTNDEWNLYQQIVKLNTTLPYQKGEDLFADLFETNEDGLIIFLRAPTQRHTTFGITIFLQNLLINQQLRLSHQRVDDLCAKLNAKLVEVDNKLHEIEAKEKRLAELDK